MRAFTAVLFIAIVFSTACDQQQHDPRESLPDALRDFHGHLMWGRYSDASGYLPVAQRNAFVGAYQAMPDDLRFTEYETDTLGQNDEDNLDEVEVLVTYRWYRAPDYIVRTTKVLEVWSFDDDTEYWWLVERNEPEDDETEAAL